MCCFFKNNCGYPLDAKVGTLTQTKESKASGEFYKHHTNMVWGNRILMITAIFLITWGINGILNPGQFGTDFDSVLCLIFGGAGFALTVWKSYSLDTLLRKANQNVGLNDEMTLWQMLETCLKGRESGNQNV